MDNLSMLSDVDLLALPLMHAFFRSSNAIKIPAQPSRTFIAEDIVGEKCETQTMVERRNNTSEQTRTNDASE
jgi:hypothetical protein